MAVQQENINLNTTIKVTGAEKIDHLVLALDKLVKYERGISIPVGVDVRGVENLAGIQERIAKTAEHTAKVQADAMARQTALAKEQADAMARQAAAAAAAASKSAKIAPRTDDGILRQRWKNGSLAETVYTEGRGATRKVDTSKPESVETREFNWAKEASLRVRTVRDRYEELIKTQKAGGASAADLNNTYKKYADQLERVAKGYSDIDRMAGLGIASQASRVRKEGQRGVLRENGQQAKAELKAQQDAINALGAFKEKSIRKNEADAVALARQKSTALEKEERNRLSAAEKQRKANEIKAKQDRAVLLQRMEAERLVKGFDTEGYTLKQSGTTKTGKGKAVETNIYSRESMGIKESSRVIIERDKAGRILNATVAETNKVMTNAAKVAESSTQGFLKNTAATLAWSLSFGVMYGAVNLLKSGFNGMKDIEARTAVLSQVFRGTLQDSLELRDGVLALGVAYGQSSADSIDAATRFARLGLTKVEILEATAVALKAANVAEIDVTTAAEQLSAIMVSYNLNVGDLRKTLTELNQISNTYNASNREMLNGIARVAPLAKQAGLSLNELTALIGAGIGSTGRPGSEFGNSIKALLVSVANPKMQGKLKDAFQVDVKGPDGEIKQFSQTLQELFVTYQKLNQGERQAMTQLLGGKMQASRLTSLFDNYIQAQVLSIRASRDMTSADKENEKIRATLANQLQGLTTEWEALFAAMGKSNINTGVNTFLKNFVELLKHLMELLTAFPNITSTFASGIAVMGVAMLVSMASSGKLAAQNGFLANSMVQCRMAVQALWKEFLLLTRATSGAIPGLNGLIKALFGVGAAAAVVEVLTGLVLIMAAVAAVTALADVAMEGFNGVIRTFADDAEKATAALAGYNEKLTELRGLAKAEGDLARLSDTLKGVIQNPNSSTQEIQEYLKLYEEVAGLQQGELSNLAAVGDKVGILNKLQETGNNARKKQAGYAAQERKETRIALADAKTALALREQKLSSNKEDKQKDEVAKNLRNRIEELRGKTIERAIETGGSEDSAPAEENQALTEQTKLLEYKLDLLDKIYGALSRSTGVERVHDEMAAQKAKLNLLGREEEMRKNNAAAVQREIQANDKAFGKKDQYEAYLKAKDEYEDHVLTSQKKSQPLAPLFNSDNLFKWKGGAKIVGDLWTGGIERMKREKNDNLWKRTTGGTEDEEAIREYVTYQHENVDLQQKGAAWAQKNTELKAREVALGVDIKGGQAEINAAQQKDVELQQKKLELQERQERLMDAMASGKRESNSATAGARVGTSETAKDLAEMRSMMNRRGEINDLTKIGNPAAALQEFNQLQDRLKAGRGGPEDEVRSMQLLEQLRSTGVRMEEMRFSAIARVHTIEAEITNEKRKQQEEASKSLLMASREEQLRAAAAAKFGQQRGGKRFSAEEFQYLDQDTRRGIQQNNPDLAPKELGGHLQELEAEQQQLVGAFRGAGAGAASLMEEFQKKADQFKALQFEAPMTSMDGAGKLIGTAVEAMANQVAGSVGNASQVIQSSIEKLANDFDAKIVRIIGASVQLNGVDIGNSVNRARSGM